MNQENISLVYNTRDNPDRMVNSSEPLKDSVSKWAGTLRIVLYRTFVIKGIEIVEFSAPVISDVFSEEPVIRSNLSRFSEFHLGGHSCRIHCSQTNCFTYNNMAAGVFTNL